MSVWSPIININIVKNLGLQIGRQDMGVTKHRKALKGAERHRNTPKDTERHIVRSNIRVLRRFSLHFKRKDDFLHYSTMKKKNENKCNRANYKIILFIQSAFRLD